MDSSTAADLFDGGPPLRLQSRLGLIKPGNRHTGRRIFIQVLLAWVPLAILTALQQAFAHDRSFWYFLEDCGVSARFLVAAPCLILAESMCLPHLSQISYHFLDSGIVRGEDRRKLQTEFERTARRLNSIWLEIGAALFAYAAVAALILILPEAELPRWHIRQGAHGLALTAAGQWHVLVSLPIFLLLLFGWLCRQLLWWRLLWVISRMELRLIASHPDESGGLQFVTSAIRGYSPLGFAFSAVAAGRIGNELIAGSTLYESRYLIPGVLVFVCGFVLLPFGVFVPKLRALKRRGVYKYGVLGRTVGEQLELKWLSEPQRVTQAAFEEPDFSTTTDLNSIIRNVLEINYFVVDWHAVVELVIISFLPFVPVVLAVMPLDVIVRDLAKLLV